jgi:UDP-sugar transporter A1/2/3
LSNLDAATFQVTYQLKLLTTAIFAMALLKKSFTLLQWSALGLLTIAVALVQWPSSSSSPSSPSTATGDTTDVGISDNSMMKLVGLGSVLLACVSSGFSGVYFEKMLKGSQTSIWIRNIQLGILGLIFGLMAVFINDYNKVMKDGFFQGYNYVVFTVIGLQAVGGLIVAAVIKYADNILKGFATAISIITSSILSFFLLHDFDPSIKFGVGVVLVITSTFMYSQPSAKQTPKVEVPPEVVIDKPKASDTST